MRVTEAAARKPAPQIPTVPKVFKSQREIKNAFSDWRKLKPLCELYLQHGKARDAARQAGKYSQEARLAQEARRAFFDALARRVIRHWDSSFPEKPIFEAYRALFASDTEWPVWEVVAGRDIIDPKPGEREAAEALVSKLAVSALKECQARGGSVADASILINRFRDYAIAAMTWGIWAARDTADPEAIRVTGMVGHGILGHWRELSSAASAFSPELEYRQFRLGYKLPGSHLRMFNDAEEISSALRDAKTVSTLANLPWGKSKRDAVAYKGFFNLVARIVLRDWNRRFPEKPLFTALANVFSGKQSVKDAAELAYRQYSDRGGLRSEAREFILFFKEHALRNGTVGVEQLEKQASSGNSKQERAVASAWLRLVDHADDLAASISRDVD